jgi:Predicted AAA-ATPase/PD-(D/E)XK nuclease superfamily
MKPIPYGESNFASIVHDGSFFVDKTPFLALLEKNSKHLVFLRPRRFGKSLWISIMQHYYGLEHKANFETLFGHLEIGKNPTALANGYLVLVFDFSGIATETTKSTKAGFLRNVRIGIQVFLQQYQTYFPPSIHKEILKGEEPADLMSNLVMWCQMTANVPKIYILVDEYDHFANELIAFRLSDFKAMVSKNGFVRKFYECIKIGTQRGAIERVFMTGVSPITVDSMSSGFNITTSLTTDVIFHDMLGFMPEQTADALRNAGATADNLPDLMADMEKWYNGYLFSPYATERLFNSDMVLYFAKHYAMHSKYPDDMLDSNIAPDYGKIRQTFRIADRETVNKVILQDVLLSGTTRGKLTTQYSLDVEFTGENFKSLLFYMGYLTIEGTFGALWIMKIPNQVIRTLYWEYFATLTREQTGLVVKTDDLVNALGDLAMFNDPHPLIDLVVKTLKALSNRDNQNFDEKHLKAIMASYLSLSSSYLMRSEFESERKYIDVLLLKRPPFDMPHQFAFELKYLKKDATQATIDAKVQEAEAQINIYKASAELDALENLRAWIVVIAGTEAKVVRLMDN